MASASALERGRHRFMDEAAQQEHTPQQENTRQLAPSLEERKESPPLHTANNHAGRPGAPDSSDATSLDLGLGLDDDITPISTTAHDDRSVDWLSRSGEGQARRCRCLRRAFAKLRIPGDDSEDGPQMSAFLKSFGIRSTIVSLLFIFLFGLLVGVGIDLFVFKAAGMFWTQWLAVYSTIGAGLFSVRLLIAHLYRGGGSRKFEELYDLVIFIFFFILVHAFAAQATNTTWEFHTQVRRMCVCVCVCVCV